MRRPVSIFLGDEGFPEGAAVNSNIAQLGPRVGFAYDLTGDGRMSLRGYYGIAYDFGVAQNLGNSASAPPHAFRTTLTSPAGGLDNPWLGSTNPFPYVSSAENAVFDQFGNWLPMSEYDMDPPKVQSWNLNLQRQLGANLAVSATYMGNRASHLWVSQNVNPAVYTAGGPCTIAGVTYNPCSTTANTSQRRVLFRQNPAEGRFYGNVEAAQDIGTTDYHGLLLSVQRRSARGVTFGGNYTLSRCSGDNTNLGNNANTGQSYVDPDNRELDRGYCGSHRWHNLNLTGVYELPSFSNAALRVVASGWRVAGIYRASSGSFFSVTSGQDRSLTAAPNQRALQILDDPYLDRDGLNYLNPAAFRQPV